MSLLKIATMALASSVLQATEVPMPPPFRLPSIQKSGTASWYGDGQWHGDVTANGEDFLPRSARTCAHRTLPFNTVLFVVNRVTGAKNWCRVNDRGPYPLHMIDGQWKPQVVRDIYKDWKRLIDMTMKAAETIGPLPQGVYRIDLHYWPIQSVTYHLETLDKQYL